MELVAQIQLYNKYGIITENVDIDILRRDKINSKFINRVKKRKFKRIALKEDYELLLYYGDELGKLYYKNKDEMMELSNYRNDSILAHGLVSLDDKKFDKLNKKVFEFARVLKPDIDY